MDMTVGNINAPIESSGLFLRAHLKNYVLPPSDGFYQQSN